MLDGQAPAPPGFAALAEILGAVSREIAGMAEVTCALQDTLSPAVLALVQDDGVIKELQALDLIAQHLAGVADFLNALAPSLPGHWSGDAAAAAGKVSLANLAQRLGGLQETPQAAEDDTGALELFG